MKTRIVFSIFVMLFCVSLFAQSDVETEKAAIKKVIQDAYADGIGNNGDVEAMKKGFHPGFAILGFSKNSLWKYPIYRWVEAVEGRIKEGKYPPEEKITFKYPLIDIVGNAAIVKIEYYQGEKLKYTDYLSLYKFEQGWKIVNKIFYEHKE